MKSKATTLKCSNLDLPKWTKELSTSKKNSNSNPEKITVSEAKLLNLRETVILLNLRELTCSVKSPDLETSKIWKPRKAWNKLTETRLSIMISTKPWLESTNKTKSSSLEVTTSETKMSHSKTPREKLLESETSTPNRMLRSLLWEEMWTVSQLIAMILEKTLREPKPEMPT